MPNTDGFPWKNYSQKFYLVFDEVTNEYEVLTEDESGCLKHGPGVSTMARTWFWECEKCGDRLEIIPQRIWLGASISGHLEGVERDSLYEEIINIAENGSYFSTWVKDRVCEAKVGPRRVCYGNMIIQSTEGVKSG